MYKKLNLALVLCLFLTSAYAHESNYKVDLTDYKQKIVHVNAEFALFGSNILGQIINVPANLKDGQAHFIKNLVVKDQQGKQIKYKNLGEGDWSLAVKDKDQVVHISYDIELGHDKFYWPGGIEEIAYQTDEGMFFTGFTTFIVPNLDKLADNKNVRIDFKLPDGWKVSSPWNAIENTKNGFLAQDARFLLNNCFFAGIHQERNVNINGFNVKIAYGKKYTNAIDLFETLIYNTSKLCLEIFGGTMATDYLIVINESDVITDGGAFRRSFSQTIKGEVDLEGRVVWGHVMVHEMVHLWNGLTIMPEGQEEWFKEGFTDYVANLILLKSNTIDQNTLFKRFEKIISKYVYAKLIQNDVSLKDAGNDKEKNRLYVYGGGEMVAMAMDVEMRKASSNKAGVTDLMRQMYEIYGKTGQKYTTKDIIDLAQTLSGKDLTSFISRYVMGKDFLDITPYLNEMGLHNYTFVEESYISVDKNASTDAIALRKSILGI